MVSSCVKDKNAARTDTTTISIKKKVRKEEGKTTMQDNTYAEQYQCRISK